MWSFGKRYRPLLGLDITTSSVKLIELTMSGGQYRVESYAAEPTPHNAINEKAIVDAEAVGEAIRRAVKRSGAKSRLAAIAISRRRRDHESDSNAEEPRRKRTRRSGRDAGRPIHSLSDGRSQLRLSGRRSLGKGSGHARRAAGRDAHRERRAAPGGGASLGPDRAPRRRRGFRARECLRPDAPSDAGRRHRPHRRGGRFRRQQHDIQRAARHEGHLHPRFRLRRTAAHRRNHAHLRALHGRGRAAPRRKAACRATISPKCSIRSSTT